MPFGARNSVFSFAGFGKALQIICSILFVLPSSEYVDDFTQVGLQADHRAKDWMTRVMHLLGWQVQDDPEKALDFAKVVLPSAYSSTAPSLEMESSVSKISQGEYQACCRR